ncbi:MAG: hypothetical protein ABGZ24_04555, partial [Fuerstiella sp.]
MVYDSAAFGVLLAASEVGARAYGFHLRSFASAWTRLIRFENRFRRVRMTQSTFADNEDIGTAAGVVWGFLNNNGAT